MIGLVLRTWLVIGAGVGATLVVALGQPVGRPRTGAHKGRPGLQATARADTAAQAVTDTVVGATLVVALLETGNHGGLPLPQRVIYTDARRGKPPCLPLGAHKGGPYDQLQSLHSLNAENNPDVQAVWVDVPHKPFFILRVC